MGKLEGWIARHLRPRFKISESIRAGVNKMKASMTSVTDLADVIKIEEDNRSLRRELVELQNIITQMKRAGNDTGVIHLTRKPDDPPPATRPAQDFVNAMMPTRLTHQEELILIGDRDSALRQLATANSRVTQLEQRLTMLQTMGTQALQLLDLKDPGPTFHLLLADILRTATIGAVSANRAAVHFDDLPLKSL